MSRDGFIVVVMAAFESIWTPFDDDELKLSGHTTTGLAVSSATTSCDQCSLLTRPTRLDIVTPHQRQGCSMLIKALLKCDFGNQCLSQLDFC